MSYWKGRQYIGVGPGEVRGQQNGTIAPVDYVRFFSPPRQAHMADLLSRAREVTSARPGLRLWSLMCGSGKYSRGDTGHGGGLNWTIWSCELLHLQAVVLPAIMTPCDRHRRSFYSCHVKCSKHTSARSGRGM